MFRSISRAQKIRLNFCLLRWNRCAKLVVLHMINLTYVEILFLTQKGSGDFGEIQTIMNKIIYWLVQMDYISITLCFNSWNIFGDYSYNYQECGFHWHSSDNKLVFLPHFQIRINLIKCQNIWGGNCWSQKHEGLFRLLMLIHFMYKFLFMIQSPLDTKLRSIWLSVDFGGLKKNRSPKNNF